MKIPTIMRAVTILVLLCAGISVLSESVRAQVMDFSQIDAFESMGTGTVHGGSSPKTIIDDGERHTIFITVLESDTDAKVYWKSLDGNPQTTILHGPGFMHFKPPENLSVKPLAAKIRVSNMGICCSVLENDRMSPIRFDHHVKDHVRMSHSEQ